MVTQSGRWAAILCAALFSAQGGRAQEPAGTGDRLIEAVARCRADTDPQRRLACFDRAADSLIEARQRNEITVLSTGEVKEGQRAVFGLPVTSERLYGRAAAKLPPVETLDSVATRVTVAGRDTFTVVLQDGGVWRTTERARYEPEVGDTVHIKRGALGSYLASFAGARSVRIERVR